jgi:hypothetical protein
MRRSSELAETPPRLQECWQRWAEVVADFARRAPHRRAHAEAEYTVRHREFLAECRRAAEQVSAQQRRCYEQLHDLAAPWLSTSQLEQADPMILSDLLRRCRQNGLVLGGWRRAWREMGWGREVFRLALLAVTLAVLALLGLVWLDRQGGVRRGWLAWWSNFARLNAGEWLVLAGLPAMLLGSLLVMKMSRR